jgi:hypothetical protein
MNGKASNVVAVKSFTVAQGGSFGRIRIEINDRTGFTGMICYQDSVIDFQPRALNTQHAPYPDFRLLVRCNEKISPS